MPLVLSLFVAFSVLGKTTNSELDNAIVSLKPLVYKAVTKKASTKLPKLTPSKNSITKAIDEVESVNTSSTSILYSEIEGNSSFEENSYKNIPFVELICF